MQRPPPVANILSCPVTTAICISAVIVTVWWHTGGNVDRLVIDYAAFYTEPWRLVTWVLPHVGFFHLLFNLYWSWVFGTQIERLFGSTRTFAIMVFLAVGSGVADYALSSGGGVGLSGVGYGLFGLIWVLGRYDSRFFGAVDHQTVVLFIGWFFLCILLTYTGTMPVANVAHGAGAVLGVMLGWTMVAKKREQQILYAVLITIVFAAIMTSGSVGRRYINFTGAAAREDAYRANVFAYAASIAAQDKDYTRAAELFRQALAIDETQADWWYRLGIVYRHLKKQKEATDAFNRARQLSSKKDIQ
jgi:membrane associated rhomboid family serine protease